MTKNQQALYYCKDLDVFERTFQVEVDFPTRDLDDAGDVFFESEPKMIADFPWYVKIVV